MTKITQEQKQQTAGGSVSAATVVAVVSIALTAVNVITSIVGGVIKHKRVKNLPPPPPEIHFSRNTLSTHRILH